jgi:hypothetical protein
MLPAGNQGFDPAQHDFPDECRQEVVATIKWTEQYGMIFCYLKEHLD